MSKFYRTAIFIYLFFDCFRNNASIVVRVWFAHESVGFMSTTPGCRMVARKGLPRQPGANG